MAVSAVSCRRAELGQVVEPEPRRQLRHLPQAAHHAAAEPGPAGAHGRQRVHLAAGRVRLGRAGDPDQQQAGRAGQADRDQRTTSAMGMLGREVTAATDRVGLGRRRATPRSATGCPRPRPRSRSRSWTPGPRRAQPAGGTAAGENLVRWDGLDGAGRRAAAGSYQVRVEAARADGTAIAAEQYLTGTVEGDRAGCRRDHPRRRRRHRADERRAHRARAAADRRGRVAGANRSTLQRE